VRSASEASGSEDERRACYFLFPNPVRRELLVLGRIAASLIVSAAGLSLYYGAAAIGALIVTHSLTWDVGLSYVYALAYMSAVVGIAYLLSALLKSTVAATVLTFFLFTLIFAIIGGILSLAKVDPWFIDRKSTRLNSSHEWISYAVFCLKKKKNSTIISDCEANLYETANYRSSAGVASQSGAMCSSERG